MVSGPVEPKKHSDQLGKKGIITVHVATSAFSGNEHRKRRLNDRKTVEIESIVRKTFEGVVFLELYPRSEINVTIHILENDGSMICTIINAVTLALMDAGISMSDMVTACTVGQVNGKLCVDMNQLEQYDGGAYLSMAIKSKDEELVFLQLNCKLNANLIGDALEIGIKGCKEVKYYVENAGKSHMQESLRISGVSA